MDLIGKLTQTDSGHQYICVMIDHLTKWPQAYPLCTKSAKEVTDLYQFEAPKRILTDQGKEFVNEVNSNCVTQLKYWFKCLQLSKKKSPFIKKDQLKCLQGSADLKKSLLNVPSPDEWIGRNHEWDNTEV